MVMKRNSRGQLFVVTALALAILFIVIALLLNSMVFSSGLASQSPDPGSSDAITFANSTEYGVEGLIISVNEHHNETYSTLFNNYTAGLAALEKGSTQHESLNGQNITIANASVIRGAKAFQTEFTNYTNRSQNGSWTLVNQTNAYRSFNLEFRQSSLSERNTSWTTTQEYNESNYFRISIAGQTATHKVYIYRHSGNVVEVAVDNDTLTCTETTSNTMTLNLINATLDGTPCEPLTVLDQQQSPYNISYVSGTTYHRNVEVLRQNPSNTTIDDTIVGTYEVTFVGNFPDIDQDDYYTNPSSGNYPLLVRQLYAGEVEIDYTGPVGDYNTYVDAMPGVDHD